MSARDDLEVAAIVRLYGEGLDLRSIATWVGVSRETVRRVLIENGVARRSRGRPRIRQTAMIADWFAGMSMREIAKRYGVSTEGVRAQLAEVRGAR
jgi:transposase